LGHDNNIYLHIIELFGLCVTSRLQLSFRFRKRFLVCQPRTHEVNNAQLQIQADTGVELVGFRGFIAIFMIDDDYIKIYASTSIKFLNRNLKIAS